MEKPVKYTLVIHGGAGGIYKEIMTKEMCAIYENKLKDVLLKSSQILEKGGLALDAVETAIKLMEECTLFDAGKGAVVNENGEPEMDASIMDGSNYKAGSVAGIKTMKHPISLARKVLENTPHVMIFGEGADIFGKQLGLDTVTKEYFSEEPRYWELIETQIKPALKGTVGAVALDSAGNIAAGTSTGGTLRKMKGRVGDSPVIGAGTFADSNTCGVSCTGYGEYFIRGVVAHNISALMEYKGLSIQEATKLTLANKVAAIGGQGGIISLDKNGNIAIEYNTEGMLRGYIKSDQAPHVFF